MDRSPSPRTIRRVSTSALRRRSHVTIALACAAALTSCSLLDDGATEAVAQRVTSELPELEGTCTKDDAQLSFDTPKGATRLVVAGTTNDTLTADGLKVLLAESLGTPQRAVTADAFGGEVPAEAITDGMSYQVTTSNKVVTRVTVILDGSYISPCGPDAGKTQTVTGNESFVLVEIGAPPGADAPVRPKDPQLPPTF